MARTDNLNNFLTDVADSIREKKGTTGLIPASEFDTEIDSIETGGGSTVTKGMIINEFDKNGYVTDVSVVGMTSIPDYYFAAYNDTSRNALNKYVKNIQLPSGVTSIGNNAFQYCTELALTSLPSGVTSIGNSAFQYCTKLALTSLPNGVISIGNNAFQYCRELALTSLPNGVTSIGIAAFNGCTKLALTSLPSGVTSIGSITFNGCTKLALTSLPSGVTSIGSQAFDNCIELALTELPSGVTSIAMYAFRKCTNLAEMTCLGNITIIKSDAFSNCTKLSKFALPNITRVPTLDSTNSFNNTPIANGTGYIYVPDDLVESFKSATNWSTYANQIKAISEMEASA